MQNSQRKIVSILQPGYMPWLGYFEQMARADIFVHYDDVQYDKGSWRNRNRIKTARGPLFLTVPVLTKGKQLQPICAVRINNTEKWQKKHEVSIRQNYGKTFFFTDYAESLFSIIYAGYDFLIDLDIALIRWISAQLGINTPTIQSSKLHVTGNGVERLINIIKKVNGTCFYEGSAGRNYIDGTLFTSEGIDLQYQDYIHPQYRQQFNGFVPYLSIIDLLFNCGRDSLSILVSCRK